MLFQDTSLVYMLSIRDFLTPPQGAQRDGRLVECTCFADRLFAGLVYHVIYRRRLARLTSSPTRFAVMIDINHINKWYGPTFQVLTDRSTDVTKGEVVVVCGRSDSGKSTLIKCVNALEPFSTATSWSTARHHRSENQSAQTALACGHGVPALGAVPPSKITDNLCLAQQKVLGR